jgi:DNA-binding IscR family transcriptional regulator
MTVSADVVAEDARTSPKTARKHLKTLAEEGFVVTATGEHGGTVYRRSSESLVVEQAADILKHVSTDELVTRIGEMRDQLNDYQQEYGVDSPEELTIEQANQALAEPDSDQSELDAETIREWQTTRRNLAFANAALSIANAERFVDGDLSSTDENVLA